MKVRNWKAHPSAYAQHAVKYAAVLDELMGRRVRGKQAYERYFLPAYAEKFPAYVRRQVGGRQKGLIRMIKGRKHHFLLFVKYRGGKLREEVRRLMVLRRAEVYAAAKLASRQRGAELLERLKRAREEVVMLRAEETRKRMEREKVERARRQAVKKPGQIIHQENMILRGKRKEAKRIKAEFLAQWEADYSHLFRRTKKAEKRRYREIRQQRAKAKRDPNVWRLRRKIQNNPCDCYWCEAHLPNGGEVDHVVPLAAGGDDGHGNLVPSCQRCNRTKHAILPDSPDFPVSDQFEMLLISK